MAHRKLFLAAAALVLMAAPCFAQQHASVSVNAHDGPRDTRPFGKYLVEICALSGERRTLTCTPTPLSAESATKGGRSSAARPPLPATPQKLDQTLSISLVCDPASKAACNLQYPLIAGSDFFVSATVDSGQAARQRVLSGPATPFGGPATVQYRANAPGSIIIRATAPETARFAEAAPVDLILAVVPSAADVPPACPVLPPVPPPSTSFLDAPTIVTLLGSPTPFLLSAQGPNTIAIYSARQPLRGDESHILDSFQESIGALALRTGASLGISPAPGKPFSVELSIPHAAAMGDLATRIGALNFSQFTLQDAGTGRLRVTAPATPDCDSWTRFLSGIRLTGWQLISEPMSTKLYYLSSSDVATAFSGLAPAAPAAAATTAPATTSAPAPAASPSSASVTVTQPLGSNLQISSDTTPCVFAGLAAGNSGACGSASTTPSPSAPAASVTPAPAAPIGMSSVAVAMAGGEQTPPDLLVYSDTTPGDDAQILERNRIIAQLDLPRPEMIINAWVTQNSTASQQSMGAFTNMVKNLVADYDREFEMLVLRGWDSVKNAVAQPGYFNEPFRSYIEDRFVGDTFRPHKPTASARELAQAFLDTSQAELADPVAPGHRKDLHICERGRYCLGYNDLFHPLKPGLTDLLLTIIAAQDPVTVAHNAIDAVEGGRGVAPMAASGIGVCERPEPDAQSRCETIWKTLDIDHATPGLGPKTCADLDFRGIVASLQSGADHEPTVHLNCFAEQVGLLFAPHPGDIAGPYGPGLLRAAIADFLFNYKLSQQYPHEFTPYDLSHSADALNNALSPIMEAFNRDLAAYQLFVRADMQYRVDALNRQNDKRASIKRIFGVDKPSFFNDGLVTVRTISGQWTYVNTTSQSFLNASTAPELSTLLNTVAGSSSAAPGTNTLASTLMTGNPLKRFESLAQVLAQYQTTFAQIGRALQFSAIPRSLNTASSAEIAVTLNADESAGGPTYTGGNATDPAANTSRVANHDTATRVRVDSVKLFEISSLTAIVERSRSRFPLLPPFVEIPYIGTFAGIPLGPAKEFHSSAAILSAYVVPTATDIAYGLRFTPDLVVDGLNPGRCSFYPGAAGPDVPNACLFHKALSLKDFDKLPVPAFNRAITSCFAKDISATGCGAVTFDSVPRMDDLRIH